MLEYLLENSGRSIKNVVNFVFKVNCGIAVLIVIIATIIGQFPGFLVGVLVGGIIVFGAWLCSLLLHAFGEMAEATVEISKAVKGMKQEQPAAAHKPASARKPVAVDMSIPVGHWKCSKCGKVNDKDYQSCILCGTVRTH